MKFSPARSRLRAANLQFYGAGAVRTCDWRLACITKVLESKTMTAWDFACCDYFTLRLWKDAALRKLVF